MGLVLGSPAFANGANIPSKYTCEGQDIAPPLAWGQIPADSRSLVLIVDDPDAPDPASPQMTWVHWLLFNIPPGTKGLAEGATSRDLPKGTGAGLNDWKRTGYGGPCPPIGRHRYFFKLYALDVLLEGLGTPAKAMLESAMHGHIMDKAELIGTYQKKR
ncbi:MAG: YbhB/YbcL family Raf kinase inhibitor-like protein [Gammaproteobacteria bacterium]